METKNTVANESNEPKRNNPHVTARIDRLVDYENTKVKAIASVNIGGAFAIHGLRIIDSQKGLFVQMPQHNYQKDGTTMYTDIFHPVTAEARNELMEKVMEAFRQKLVELESEVEALDASACESAELTEAEDLAAQEEGSFEMKM